MEGRFSCSGIGEHKQASMMKLLSGKVPATLTHGEGKRPEADINIEIPLDEIMRVWGGKVSLNDIEMVWTAWQNNIGKEINIR